MSTANGEQLARWFVENVCVEECALGVHDVWSRLIEDTWFQETLRKCSHRSVAQYRLPWTWVDDVFDDVVLKLHSRLCSDLTLGFDTNYGARTFGPYLRTYLFHLALHAADRIRRHQQRLKPLDETNLSVNHQRSLQQSVDLNMALRSLSNELRAVAYRLAKGHSQREIARDLNISEKRVGNLTRTIRKTL